MAQAQRHEKLRENSNLQSPQSQHWSGWKTAIVLLYDGTNTVSRWQKQESKQERFIWKYILNARNLAELCGIYEWRAIRQDQPNRVVYVLSTCTRYGNYELLGSRILGYCWHGNHKAALINDAKQTHTGGPL